nr:neutral/alkaline non-lysosomal ceramidase N-terminal domain-containing protein [Vibrio eleionomae]
MCISTTVNAETTSNFKVGAVKTDITPNNLTDMNPMGGDFTRVHDPIYMRSLLIENKETKLALISVDVIEVGDMTKARQKIEKELGIPFDHIMIVATHDHSAPRVGNVSPGALAHDGNSATNKWSEWLYDTMVSSLKTAEKKAQYAKFGIAKGMVDINVNRDLYTSQGWKIGFNPDGPSDKTVWVMKFDNLQDQPIAIVSNYAVHSVVTIGTNQISGDLAESATDYVEKQVGNEVVSLWTLSSVADQNPRIFNPQQNKSDPSTAWEAMKAQGMLVGDEIIRTSNNIKNMTPDLTISAQEKVIQCPTKRGVSDMDNINQKDVSNVSLRLELMMLNQTALTGVSGEVVTNIAKRLEQSSPVKNTLLFSLANDRIGYIPDDAAYDRPIFEVNGSPMQRGCAENAIVQNFSTMINEALAKSN